MIVAISFDDMIRGTVVRRQNRFTVLVSVNGESVLAHLADSGRLFELIYPGNTVLVRKVANEKRKTGWDVVLARYESSDIWVSVDTRIPNKLFARALLEKKVPGFTDYSHIKPEYTYSGTSTGKPRSRFDFYLEGEGLKPCLLETKSVTLVRNGIGLFPDAPTSRGARHLHELADACMKGYRSVAVFIAQRPAVVVISPNANTDPKFVLAAQKAIESGVEFLGFRCIVTPEKIIFNNVSVPFRI